MRLEGGIEAASTVKLEEEMVNKIAVRHTTVSKCFTESHGTKFPSQGRDVRVFAISRPTFCTHPLPLITYGRAVTYKRQDR